MNRKSLIGALVALLLLTGIIGANLVMAGSPRDIGRTVRNEEATDNDNLDCPAQGLPACEGQMNDEKSEGPENEADEKNEGPEDKNEANEKNEGPEHENENENEAPDSGQDD